MVDLAGANFAHSRVRLRRDIQWSRFSERPPVTWVARDPISLEYFYFSDLECQVACSLDGVRSPEHAGPGGLHTQVSDEWLLGLIGRLDQACLLVPTTPGPSGSRLWRMHERSRHRLRFARLASPLAIRVPLFDPTRLLDWLYPIGSVLFNRCWLLVTSLVAIVVASWVCMRIVDTPESLLSPLQEITISRAIGLVFIIGLVKSFHELGHALACRCHHSECHEIGLMFLVFMPCLYCDTSDSWKLPSRWRRAGIAAAGIYVELCVAILAAQVWIWTLDSSPMHYWAANLMVICSISTVLVNGNPLLRYDGYYVLSDLWGVPNLHSHSQEAVRYSLVSWLTGIPQHRERWAAHPVPLAAFAVLSCFYRHIVVLVIAWVLWNILDGVGLGLLGIVLLSITFTALLVTDLFSVSRFFRDLWVIGKLRYMRTILVLLLGFLAYAAVIYIQWPTRVSSRAVTSLQQLSPLYAERTGRLTNSEEPGANLRMGDFVASLEAPDLEMEILDVHGEVHLLRQQIVQLRVRSIDDETLATGLASRVQELTKMEERLQLLQQQAAKLKLTAPRAGRLLAAEAINVVTLSEPNGYRQALPLLSPVYRGSLVERGSLLGWVAEGQQIEVIAYVSEQDAEMIRPGMAVSCRWDSFSGDLYHATVRRVAPDPIIELPEALWGDQEIPVRENIEGRLVPIQPYYKVSVEISAPPKQIAHQALLTVHFHTAPRTLIQSLRMWFDHHIRPGL